MKNKRIPVKFAVQLQIKLEFKLKQFPLLRHGFDWHGDGVLETSVMIDILIGTTIDSHNKPVNKN